MSRTIAKQLYIGSKIVEARSMTRQAYNDYRGWKLPDDESGDDNGYLVEYLDGGKPNHPDHEGYISWSPKKQFDDGYQALGDVRHLQPHEQRLLAEHCQLADRLLKLIDFNQVNNPRFTSLPGTERALLIKQRDIMTELLNVLDQRIDLIGIPV